MECELCRLSFAPESAAGDLDETMLGSFVAKPLGKEDLLFLLNKALLNPYLSWGYLTWG